MNCWICGGEGTTGEHRTKASDLKSEFGKVSQKAPIYLSSDAKMNIKINSIKKSEALKFKSLLCPNCNNARTQPFDNAWLAVSENLRTRNSLREGSIIKLEKIFPGSVKTGMLNVHLYFLKIFGCAIQELGIPLEIKDFSQAILNETPHPKVHISFGASGGLETGLTNMETANLGNQCVFATWFYVVGSIAANIMYAEPTEKRQGLICSWHPTSVTKRIRLAKY